jgi:hypothetical protein
VGPLDFSMPFKDCLDFRWPIFCLVVVATTSCRDNKVQMIRPYVVLLHSAIATYINIAIRVDELGICHI